MTKAEYMRKWRADHPKKADYIKQWREANKDHVAAYRKQYYEQNREKLIKLSRKSKEDDWDRFLLQKRVHTANQRYPGTLTVAQLEELIEKSQRRCYWCGKENLQGRDLTLEHLRPTNAIEDLAIACSSCNCTRRTMGLQVQPDEVRIKRRAYRKSYIANLTKEQARLNKIKRTLRNFLNALWSWIGSTKRKTARRSTPARPLGKKPTDLRLMLTGRRTPSSSAYIESGIPKRCAR